MKLYMSARAPNPRRVRLFLAEKGLAIPEVNLDIESLDQKGAEHLARNPFMQVPVLDLEDGRYLSESTSICRYLDVLHPDPPLFGRDSWEKAVIDMWERRIELTLQSEIRAAFRHAHPAMARMEVPQVRDWAEACREKIPGTLRLFDQALQASPYIAGENFSYADITLLVAVDFLRPIKLDIPADCTALEAWRMRVTSRPGVTPP